jgi:hypothetical protein
MIAILLALILYVIGAFAIAIAGTDAGRQMERNNPGNRTTWPDRVVGGILLFGLIITFIALIVARFG